MTDKEKQALQYRFSGYQLPKIELDETGHTYYYIKGIHPYYTTQPMYWQKPYYSVNTPALGGAGEHRPSNISSNQTILAQNSSSQLFCMIKFS